MPSTVDTSIYAPVNRPSVLDQYGGYVGIANAAAQNKLLNIESSGLTGQAAAYRDATGPNGLDYNKLGVNASMAGPYAGDVAASALTLQKAQQDLASQQSNTAYSMYGSLLSKGSKPTFEDAAGVLTDLLQQHRITPQAYTSLQKELPTDPKNLQSYLTSRYTSTLPPEVATAPTDLGVDPNTLIPKAGTRAQYITKATGGEQAPVDNTGAGGTGVQTAPAPGQAEAMKASSDAYSVARNDVGSPTGSAARIFQLNKALTGLQGSTTGAGTEWQNDIQNFVITNAPTLGKVAGIDPATVANYDEAQKYLTAYASGQAGAMGPKTDQQLSTALTANASTHISNLAAQDVVKANIALERMRQAQVATFQKQGGQPGEFLDSSDEWNKNIDPRAFAVDLMAPDKLSKMYAGLKGNEKQKFLDSLRIAINSGVIDQSTLPGAKGAANAQ